MRVGIGPTNAAGQGYRLAVALRGAGIAAESFGIEDQHPAPLQFQVDRTLTREEWGSPAWCEYVDGFSHLLMWNGLSPYAPHRWWVHELDRPARKAAVFRGSELRVPAVHRTLEPWSPFRRKSALRSQLEARNAWLRARLAEYVPEAYVATLEMLDYLPSAGWLPIIADPAEGRPVLDRRRPVVLHFPTNGQLKGAAHVDALPLDDIDLRRPALMAPDQALAAIADADVVIGGLVLGDYGGTEIQAMAAGRVVVGNVSPRVRDRLPEACPIVQADPATLRSVLHDIVVRPEHYHEIAARGPAFHARFHDGRFSVAQLAGFLA